MFAGRVQLEEEGEPLRCAVKRLSVFKGLRPERLLQEALTMIKCQVEEQPLLLAMALGDGHYYLVSMAQRQWACDRAPRCPASEPSSPCPRSQLLSFCLRSASLMHLERRCSTAWI